MPGGWNGSSFNFTLFSSILTEIFNAQLIQGLYITDRISLRYDDESDIGSSDALLN